jgi:hypothetical protein
MERFDYRAGLVAKQVEYTTRSGKRATRTYWVRGPDAQKPKPRERARAQPPAHAQAPARPAPPPTQSREAPSDLPAWTRNLSPAAQAAVRETLARGAGPAPTPAAAPAKSEMHRALEARLGRELTPNDVARITGRPAPASTPARAAPSAPRPAPAPAAPRPAAPAAAPSRPAAAPSGPPTRENFTAGISGAGGDAEFAHDMTTDWVRDVHETNALAMGMTAARVFGVDYASTEARLRGSRQQGSLTHEERLAKARRVAADPAAESTVRAIAAVSQAAHPADADGMVTLYRGVGNARDNGDGTHTFGTDATASFTESRDVAHRFAREYGGHVVEVRVPRSAIVASHRAVPAMAGDRAHGEQEVIVASRGAFTGRRVQ